jgi:hypothetical protein
MALQPNKINMSTFQERLTVEKQELDEKIGKLKSFMESDKFASVDSIQQSLLQIQAHTMNAYSQILFERITFLNQTVATA